MQLRAHAGAHASPDAVTCAVCAVVLKDARCASLHRARKHASSGENATTPVAKSEARARYVCVSVVGGAKASGGTRVGVATVIDSPAGRPLVVAERAPTDDIRVAAS